MLCSEPLNASNWYFAVATVATAQQYLSELFKYTKQEHLKKTASVGTADVVGLNVGLKQYV